MGRRVRRSSARATIRAHENESCCGSEAPLRGRDRAAQDRLPAIYAFQNLAKEGGLMSYGVNVPHLFQNAATYVDRILKGDKPADLPVQLPEKFEFVINMKTAKSLGITVPDNLIVAADDVIE